VGGVPAGQVVFASTTTARGEAALVGYGGDGRERFRHVFPNRFPGGPPNWNEGGLTHWWAAPGQNVLATLRRSVMHTDEATLLDPAAGRELWWCASLLERGAGGQPGAIAGSDAGSILIGQYPDIHYALALRDGQPLVVRPYPNEQLGGWSGYSTPILVDVDDDGALEVLSSGSRYSIMLWSAEGQLRWHTPYLDGSSRQLGLRRGETGWEIGAVAYRGGFRCLSARDGSLLWSWPTQPGTDIVSGDVDGDGEEEFLFGVGSRLVALSALNQQAEVVWELPLPGRCGPPVLADTDSDGDVEVVLLAGDGRLYVIDQAAS
ncbi:MAG: hypothetical protein HUU35_09470, partial [Armatimonadetes bacterium]|nr:hypothetical protein [Armatimonadota bacterium]